MSITDLKNAKFNRKDEFYTRYEDIEIEMINYKNEFKDKIIYCNCDKYDESNFVKYFSDNFEEFGIKKLIATNYANRPESNLFMQEEYSGDKSYKMIRTTDGTVVEELKENGSFDSSECIELLKECDIVITNPPFSLFKEFFNLLMKYNKKFIILGNMCASSYKDIVCHFADDTAWYGKSIHSGDREFRVPDDYPLTAATSRTDEDGNKFVRIKGVRWFTNIEYEGRKVPYLPQLKETYTPDKYEKLDYYDAININKMSEIPNDYMGLIAAPVSYMDKYNPDEFTLYGSTGVGNLKQGATINGRVIYKRLLIKRK